MEKEINFKKILSNHLIFDKNWVLLRSVEAAMLEACKEVLELAYENGEVVYISDRTGEKTWLSTTEKKHYISDKNSIVETIDQVKL